jgi:AcrR family transcriptional regulator
MISRPRVTAQGWMRYVAPVARTADPELEQTRLRAIADAAVGLLVEGGWHAATLEKVAARAGLSKGALAWWFESKDAILLHAIRTFHQGYAEQLGSLVISPLPARDRLAAVVRAAFPSREVVEREVRFQVELWAAAKSNPAVAAEVQSSYQQFRLACLALLELGAAEGYVTAPDRPALAVQIQALADGLSLHLAFDPALDVEVERERLIERIDAWVRA